jgi:hypothetical protein
MIAYLVIFAILLIVIIWMLYEFRRAPYMDDNGNIINKKKNDTRIK